MNFNEKGLALLKQFEGCKLTAYPDPGTGGEPWTIGYGHTQGVKEGDVCTQEEADAFLKSDVTSTCEAVINSLHVPLNENQFSAFVCFAFNVRGWKSTPLFQCVDFEDAAGVKLHWPRYCKAAGVELAGLKARRLAELELFCEAPTL